MKRPSSVVLGILVGMMFTLMLNAGNLRAWTLDQLTIANLGAEVGSADEMYYFALIRDVRDGYLNLGNASLLEHRHAPAVAGFALLPQGLLAQYSSLELATVILLGDLLFPLLICCLAFLLFRRFLGSDALSAMLAFAFMCHWGLGWQRSMHPQVTMTVFLLSLLAFVSDSDCKKMHRRGASLFFLLLIQPIHAAYMLTVEGLQALLHVARTKRIIHSIRIRWPIALYVLVAGFLLIGLQQGADSDILAETYRRRGLIFSHLPTAPMMQMSLLFLLGISVWILRTKRATDDASMMIPILLIAGFVVLNQSLVHGRDAIFGLYYRYPLSFVLWLSAAWALSCVVPRRIAPILAVIVCAFAGVSMVHQMIVTEPRNHARSEELRTSGLLGVMAELSTRPADTVVLAPINVSNLVPVLTPHYSLFTQYARFEYAPDRELAERYLTLHALFPLDPIYMGEGDPLVFGLYAGNISARTRTWCRILVAARLSEGPCNQRLEDFIYHQDVREFIKAGTVDTVAMLRKYAVNTIITDTPLPPNVATACTSLAQSAPYTIYDCDFDR